MSRKSKPPLVLKTAEELALMRKAGIVAWRTLQMLEESIRPGVSLLELDALAEEFVRGQGMTPSFKNYAPPFNPDRQFPASLCTSVNEQVVHGLPTERVLARGDLVGIDLGVCCDGYHADTARTVGVGRIGKKARRLMRVTRQCLAAAIAQCRAGNRMREVSRAIQTIAEDAGYSVVTQLTGHGVGKYVHEAPDVPNYVSSGSSPRLRPGMTFAIEPMINYGCGDVVSEENGWTVSAEDGQLSAHYEHTIAVTESEPLVITRAPDPQAAET